MKYRKPIALRENVPIDKAASLPSKCWAAFVRLGDWWYFSQTVELFSSEASIASFREAAKYAQLAGERGEELLAGAFAEMGEFLFWPEDTNFDRIVKTVRELRDIKDGEFFAAQLATAVRVFCPECGRLGELNVASLA